MPDHVHSAPPDAAQPTASQPPSALTDRAEPSVWATRAVRPEALLPSAAPTPPPPTPFALQLGDTPDHGEVLQPAQRLALQRLAPAAQERGTALVGGLALGCWLGHRRTTDADIRDLGVFSADTCEQGWKEAGFQKTSIASEGHLGMHQVAGSADGVRIEVSALPAVDRSTVIQPQTGMPVASFDEVVRLKMLALVNRGRKRDFIDMYAVMQVPGYDAERCVGLLQEVESTVRAPTARSVLVGRLLAAPARPGYDRNAPVDRIPQADGSVLPDDDTCIRGVQAAFAAIRAD
jgi:hypothetical protein